jgi:hypothetical protein
MVLLRPGGRSDKAMALVVPYNSDERGQRDVEVSVGGLQVGNNLLSGVQTEVPSDISSMLNISCRRI